MDDKGQTLRCEVPYSCFVTVRESQNQRHRRVEGGLPDGHHGSRWSGWSARLVHSDSAAQESPAPWPQSGVVFPSALCTPGDDKQLINYSISWCFVCI